MDSNYAVHRNRHRGYDPPSFSSTLLDSICRSFDDSGQESSRSRLLSDECCNNGGKTMMTRSGSCYTDRSVRRNLRIGEADGVRSRDRIVDRWIEKTAKGHEESFVVRRKSLTPDMSIDFSSKSSSDSSSGTGFSSSDTDSFSSAKKKMSLKPIRIIVSDFETFCPLTTQSDDFSDENRHSNGSSGRRSAKSRAMKFYGDLKRMKQPISPGGKLASFLNSLFNAGGNTKKQRISPSIPATVTGNNYSQERLEGSGSKSNFRTNATPTCITASSYTRSCLSKSPMSASRSGSMKRSVRFCPFSVIVDEDLKPCGHKSLHGDEDDLNTVTDGASSNPSMEKNRKSVEEVARDLMRNYHKKWELNGSKEVERFDDQDDGEDVESCCSSDLFELENLTEIGVDRYCDELPVYETTHVSTNRAIVSAFFRM